MQCARCEKESKHSIQIREGDPRREPDSHAPDKSHLRVVGLCDTHWEQLREFLGI